MSAAPVKKQAEADFSYPHNFRLLYPSTSGIAPVHVKTDHVKVALNLARNAHLLGCYGVEDLNVDTPWGHPHHYLGPYPGCVQDKSLSLRNQSSVPLQPGDKVYTVALDLMHEEPRTVALILSTAFHYAWIGPVTDEQALNAALACKDCLGFRELGWQETAEPDRDHPLRPNGNTTFIGTQVTPIAVLERDGRNYGITWMMNQLGSDKLAHLEDGLRAPLYPNDTVVTRNGERLFPARNPS